MVFRSRGQPCAATLIPQLNASERTALYDQFTERGADDAVQAHSITDLIELNNVAFAAAIRDDG